MFTEIDGLKLRYDIAGEGEPVVLLHGWGSSLDAFVNIKNVISKKYKVISKTGISPNRKLKLTITILLRHNDSK